MVIKQGMISGQTVRIRIILQRKQQRIISQISRTQTMQALKEQKNK